MNIRWIAITLLAASTLPVAGCGGAAPKSTAPAPASPAAEGSKVVPATFETLKESMLPPELEAWTGINDDPAVRTHARVGGYLYVMVNGSEQRTGGYSVAVKRVETQEQPRAVVAVQALLTGPAPGTMATQAITYPKSYIRIPYADARPEPEVVVTVERETVAAKPPAPAPTAPVIANPVPVTPPAVPVPSAPAPEVAVEAVEAAELPAALAGWRQVTADAPTAAAAYSGDQLYVMVAAGERPTGGYRVEVTGMQVKDGRVLVDAVLHKPAPGQIVTQALTYPKAYARVAASGSGTAQVTVNWK